MSAMKSYKSSVVAALLIATYSLRVTAASRITDHVSLYVCPVAAIMRT